MENEEIQYIETQPFSEKPEKKSPNRWKRLAILFIGAFIFTQVFDITVALKPRFGGSAAAVSESLPDDLEKLVLPPEGVTLPIHWGNLGRQMIDAGVVDAVQFEALYAERGGLDDDAKKILYDDHNDAIVMNERNAPYLLNLLWAFGLANSSQVLERGPIQDPQYGGADRFAATGGWTLAQGDPMIHFNNHKFVQLTQDQQDLVERVAKNIYRPCCGNSTYFPDCNHGMAMLGLLELMAASGTSESDMYKTALAVNAYWFPDTYLTIAQFLKEQGKNWRDADPKMLLGAEYSSAEGYQKILSSVKTPARSEGGSCGV